MLQDYSTDRFHLLLAKSGISSFRQPADYYGLSMILGGGEVSLWELTGMYASMSRVLKEYNQSGGYTAGSYRQPTLVAGASSQNAGAGASASASAGVGAGAGAGAGAQKIGRASCRETV